MTAPTAETAEVSRLGVLRDRDFRRYFTGQTASLFGNSLSSFALAFAVLALTHSATALATVLLASRLPVIALVVLGGVLGDRYTRRRIMAITDTARTLLQAATAALLLTGHANLWSLALLQAAAGTASAMFTPAATGLVANLAPPGQLRQATSLLGLSASTAQITAVAAAGGLVATVGPGAAFAADAATFAVSTATLLTITDSSLTGRPATKPGLARQAAEGWHAVRCRPWLLTYAAHVAVLNTLAVSPFLVLGPLLATHGLGGAPAWAALGATYATGGVAGNTISLRWQPARPLLTAILASTLLAPLLALLAAAAPLWLLAPAALLAGTQATAYNAWATATAQTHLPDHLRSRVASITTLAGLAAVPLGMTYAGITANHLGTPTVFAIAAATTLLAALTAATVPSLRTLTARPT